MKCERDCPGTIEDGYCDTCGMAPVSPKTLSAPTTPRQRPSSVSSRSGALSTRTAASSRTGSGRTGSRRRFGGGLVDVTPLAPRDPATAVMAVAEVPEDKRYCGNCGNPVGRSRGDRPGRTSGFCPSCGAAYDVTPKLQRGDLVAGQYEVVGALAHGGLGWIHLAVDKNVSDRWVVLKGLLNSTSEDAQAAAVAERRFLAEVEHPNIVKIYNFVEHDGAGYIVMEYVGGESLKGILKNRLVAAGKPDPLPVDQALAYVLEVLPAFGYLHDRGLIFCDFKPDNVIQTGDQVKLIDLGGVVHIDDQDAALYGTVGYQAPEIAELGPSPQSDLFTIGRTLAVLTTDFRGYQSTYKDSLPDRGDFAVYRDHESFYRLIQRATMPHPADRFADAAELTEQMLGVLREVLAAGDGQPRPAPSRLFTAELPTAAREDGPSWRMLPTPMVDLTDPAAAFLASVTVTDPREVLTLLATAPQQTIEVRLRAVKAYIELEHDGRAEATRTLDAITGEFGPDWRVAWYEGLLALASGTPGRAREKFDAVYSALPGELAPKLGLAVAHELSEAYPVAGGYYDVVSRTDPAYTTAAAGLARCRLATGDRDGAVEAYNRVPGTSAAYRGSQVGAVRALVRGKTADVTALATAAALIERLEMEAAQVAVLRAELFEQTLGALRTGARVPVAVLGRAGDGSVLEREVRFALESAYREMARAAEGSERIRLVDMANAARPRTTT